MQTAEPLAQLFYVALAYGVWAAALLIALALTCWWRLRCKARWHQLKKVRAS